MLLGKTRTLKKNKKTLELKQVDGIFSGFGHHLGLLQTYCRLYPKIVVRESNKTDSLDPDTQVEILCRVYNDFLKPCHFKPPNVLIIFRAPGPPNCPNFNASAQA